jgi:hypothetical protein
MIGLLYRLWVWWERRRAAVRAEAEQAERRRRFNEAD